MSELFFEGKGARRAVAAPRRSLAKKNHDAHARAHPKNTHARTRWAVVATGFVSNFSTHANNAIYASPSFLRTFKLPALETAVYYAGGDSGAAGIAADAEAVGNDCQARGLLKLMVRR